MFLATPAPRPKEEGAALRLIDSHCHPQMGDYDGDRADVIRRSLDAGIGLIAVGTTLVDSLAGVKLAESHPDQPVWTAVGIHPTDEDLEAVHPAQLHGLLGSKKIVAIGETGLDYFHVDDAGRQDLQADIFEQHILLAAETNLPLIVHCRDKNGAFDAYNHVLTLLTRHQVKRFVMHCYSGTWELSKKFLALGGMLSFTGILTFPKSETAQDVAKRMPLDRMMIETDAPFLAPEPHRGKRNEPAYVRHVAVKVAGLRGETVEMLSAATTANAVNFFGLKKTPTGSG